MRNKRARCDTPAKLLTHIGYHSSRRLSRDGMSTPRRRFSPLRSRCRATSRHGGTAQAGASPGPTSHAGSPFVGCTGLFFQDSGSGDSDSLRSQRESSLNLRIRVQLSWLGPRREHGHHSRDVTAIHPLILARDRLAIPSGAAGKSWKGRGHNAGKAVVLISTARNPHESDPRVVSTKLCLIRPNGYSRQ